MQKNVLTKQNSWG